MSGNITEKSRLNAPTFLLPDNIVLSHDADQPTAQLIAEQGITSSSNPPEKRGIDHLLFLQLAQISAKQKQKIASAGNATSTSMYAPISQRVVQQALTNVLKDGGELSIENLKMLEPHMIMFMIGNLLMNMEALIGKNLAQQIKNKSEVQTYLNNQQFEKYKAQIEKNHQQAAAEHQGQWRTAGIESIIGLTESIYGAWKIFSSLVVGDVIGLGAGVLYLVAGLTGLVKAGLHSAKAIGISAKDLDPWIAQLHVLQTGAELATFGLDLFQAGRGIYLARQAMKPVLTKSFESGSKQALNVIAKEGANFSKHEVQAMIKSITVSVVDDLLQLKQVTASLSKDELTKVVENMLQAAVIQAVEQGGIVICTQALVKHISRAIGKELFTLALKPIERNFNRYQKVRNHEKFAHDLNTASTKYQTNELARDKDILYVQKQRIAQIFEVIGENIRADQMAFENSADSIMRMNKEIQESVSEMSLVNLTISENMG